MSLSKSEFGIQLSCIFGVVVILAQNVRARAAEGAEQDGDEGDFARLHTGILTD